MAEYLLSAAQQVFDILADQPLIKVPVTTPVRQTLAPTIRFKDIHFAYPCARQPVHKGLEFEIGAGERIGIVDTSGSGKSSIARLLERFMIPSPASLR